MKNIRNVILCGLGAVGTVYADKFCKFGDFKVLVDNTRLRRYQKNPIIYNEKTLNFNFITPDDTGYKADLIVITTKMTGLKVAINEIKNFVCEDTIIIPLLNGVTSEEIVAQTYGWNKVLYGYFIGHSAIRTGNSIRHDGVNTLVFGSDKKQDERVLRVKEYFENTGINYEIPEDIRHSLWAKYMLNVSSNPTTALLRMPFGEMINNKHFMNLAIKIMKEVELAAKAERVNNYETLINETIENLQKMCPEGKTSMLQDVEAGRFTEIDMLAGTVIHFGEKHGFQTPYCRFLKEMFDIIHENLQLHES